MIRVFTSEEVLVSFLFALVPVLILMLPQSSWLPQVSTIQFQILPSASPGLPSVSKQLP
jgi:hypothetical protein